MPRKIEALINPEVLRWARESIQLDAHEAAARIGVTSTRLADWEDGVSLPSVQQMRKVCEVYRRPLSCFYLPKPPHDFHVPHDYRRLPGKQKTLSPEFLVELRRVQYRRSVAIDLYESLPEPIDDLLGSVTRSSDPLSVAAQVRQRLGISLEVQRDWKTSYDALNTWKNAIEQLGVLVFHLEGVSVNEARGLSIAEAPLPIIAVNGKDSPRARCFTLLHEFCHLLMKHGGICDTSEVRSPQRADDQVEMFCNAVAGSVLVPPDVLRGHSLVRSSTSRTAWEHWQLKQLADEFKVSQEVILRRLLALGRTTREFYEQKRDELQRYLRVKKGARMPYARRVLRRVGQPFARIVLDAYYAERVTGSDAAEYFGAPIKYLPRIEALLAGRNRLTGGDRR
jgi:Zn-dependent peptidase ImmA (M78 family)/transcriptional regulator with XRE-family HTH domain